MIRITPASREDGIYLAECYARDDFVYKKHFFAFSKLTELAQVIDQTQKDQFWTLTHNNKISGIYFLTGLDEGYAVPSFGLYVKSEYSNRGIGSEALNHAVATVQNLGLRKMMLKVSHENIHANNMYKKKGFKFDRICNKTNQNILMLELK